MEKSSNPLLRGEGFPPFPEIRVEHVVPAVEALIAELETKLIQLEADFEPTWEGLIVPVDDIQDRLSWTWGIIRHLMGVKNSPSLRQAYEEVLPKLIQFVNRFNQNETIYYGLLTIRRGKEWERLDNAQKNIISSLILSAKLSGVGLDASKRERFIQIQLELAQLATKFSNNLLDATKAFKLVLTSKEEIAGLPPSLLTLAAQTARNEGYTNATPSTGPWVITLDYPSYIPFLKYSDRRDLREKVYRAFVSRAGGGEYDNNPIIERILALRQELAQLLGYDNYAQVSLARKMAPSVEAVEKLLEQLRVVSYEYAKKELEQLKAFAGIDDIQPWDTAYWAEKLRESKFQFTEEELRPYFPLEQVLQGLFSLASRLFGVTITPADGEAPVWHEDVRFFRVTDENNEVIAYFYLDAYCRPGEKRDGAWMDECMGRRKIVKDGKVTTRLPVAYLVCNQTPPVDGKPSLMTFAEVETLFHEFGHGLHHMLTKVDYPQAAGIRNVEWDAVELPSQFMENWCLEKNTFFAMAKHYQTGETIPSHYYEKLVAAKNFMSGSAMLRQIHFSLLDLELHSRYQPGGAETPHEVRDRLASTTTVIPPLPEDRFLCSFSHIFAGGYAAGYYSYKWAEVLSADAFAAFEEAGLDDEEAIARVGRRFRDTILALGGSMPAMDIFKQFRGREPSPEPLLRHSGLLLPLPV